MICAAAVLIAMVLGQAYTERCNKREDDKLDELKELKKRLDLLEATVSEK